MGLRRILFICSQNRLRSPTAEQIFAQRADLECASAGLNHDAENPVTPELLRWAELIFVMEPVHRSKLARQFQRHLGHARVICLGIPDDFAYMEPALIAVLKRKVEPYLAQPHG